MKYAFHPGAEGEYLEAVAFYESKRRGLGASFLTEFDQAMEQVCAAPHRRPIEKRPDIRRMGMKRFPYSVIYREASHCIEVLAVAHHRRRPLYWLGRL
jgi:toxin ParE1/3/4